MTSIPSNNEGGSLCVGIVFLHISPDDEPRTEALPFKLRKSRETDIRMEESKIDILLDLIRLFSFEFAR